MHDRIHHLAFPAASEGFLWQHGWRRSEGENPAYLPFSYSLGVRAPSISITQMVLPAACFRPMQRAPPPQHVIPRMGGEAYTGHRLSGHCPKPCRYLTFAGATASDVAGRACRPTCASGAPLCAPVFTPCLCSFCMYRTNAANSAVQTDIGQKIPPCACRLRKSPYLRLTLCSGAVVGSANACSGREGKCIRHHFSWCFCEDNSMQTWNVPLLSACAQKKPHAAVFARPVADPCKVQNSAHMSPHRHHARWS